eukprot:TRINITY_DN15231_c0_g1_i3.p1 TRINITY_DN15231_c0_g1~~TRINITY_DN15231_c0_g1_i3.p1  ORF type:complete len:396 (+),score=96.56 TRINITY_DN15231_c0_g1_i3:3-1190(+)
MGRPTPSSSSSSPSSPADDDILVIIEGVKKSSKSKKTSDIDTDSSTSPPHHHHHHYTSSSPQQKLHKALVRTRHGDERVWLGGLSKDLGKKKSIAILKTTLSPDLAKHPALDKLTTVKHTSQLNKELCKWELSQTSHSYKFGVVFARAGQTLDNDMLGNRGASRGFMEFLQFIGDIVPLKGWDKYAAGLDVDDDRDGTMSLYANHSGNQIMFHVSTLLPYNPSDPQQLARKRHIGNDVVVIVYMEAEGYHPNSSTTSHPFDPSGFRSQFNHVFVIIRPYQRGGGGGGGEDKSSSSSSSSSSDATFISGKFEERWAGTEDSLRYHVSIVARGEVLPFGPPLPERQNFGKTPLFREFLLSKLINAECAALAAPVFQDRLAKGRAAFLTNLKKTCLNK